MNAVFRRSFTRDLRKIKQRQVLTSVQRAIENVEAVNSPTDIVNLKKLVGYDIFYRIRIGEYRIGIVIEGDEVDFVRCLHRRDLYRYFP